MIAYHQHKKNFDMQRLNLNHLHTYSRVISSGSFSAAAAELGLTQPGVSLQIRQLEQRLNVRLIERRTLGIVLRQDKPVSKALRQVVDALQTLA